MIHFHRKDKRGSFKETSMEETMKVRKYLIEVDNLPDKVEKWCGMTVPQLRAIVGSEDAPVYLMNKAELRRCHGEVS